MEDAVCYTLRWVDNKPVIKPVFEAEYARLPEFIMDTLNIREVAVYDGLMFGCSPEHLLSEG